MNLRRAAVASAPLSWLYPAVTLFLTLFAIAPLTYPGFLQSYTGYSGVYNLIELHNRLSSLYAWSPAWGRAYDFFRQDGPLGYWLAEIFHLIGFSFLDSIKVIYALSFLVSAFAMFEFARGILKRDSAALLASALYVYFPAHIAAVYIRGAFGEAIAWALFPIAFRCVVQSAREKPGARTAIFCVLAFAALLLAHAGFAILFAILAGVWAIIFNSDKRKFLVTRALGAILLGLGLGALIQVPAIFSQSNFIAPNVFVPAYVYPFQFLSASWGTDLPRGNLAENAPYQIGFAAVGLTIAAAALFWQRHSENPARRVLLVAVIVSVILLALITPIAAPLWNWGLGLFLQYPFQLLAFVGFFLALGAASIVMADSRFQQIPLLAALLIIPLLTVYPYLAPEFTDFSPTRPALAQFNNHELALLDAKILRPPGVWRHGATVELQLTWQALKQPNHDYTVFLHVLDENGKEWGATDEKLQGGTLSTLKMIPGRVYSDTHGVQIDLTGPPEGYHMELGLYQTTTGERAVTETGADVLRIGANR